MASHSSIESATRLSLYLHPEALFKKRRESDASTESEVFSLGEDLVGSHENLEIPDLTEIQRMGQSTRITRTLPGADYENQSKVDGPHGKFPLVIRRIHYLRSDTPIVHLQIQSKQLIKFLKQLPHAAITLPVHDFPMKIYEPYIGIFHYWHEIRQAYSDPKYAAIKEDLSYLIKFQTEKLATRIRDVEVLHRDGRISFDHLWALFKPGDLVALKRAENTGNHNYWVTTIQRYKTLERNGEKLWGVEVVSTQIVGSRVGKVKLSFEFPAFLGTMPISELKVIPLNYLPHPEADRIKKDVLARSTDYQALQPCMGDPGSEGRRTPAHRQYKGPIWFPTQTTEDETGCDFFDPPSCHIESEVVIDPALFVDEDYRFMVDVQASTPWKPSSPRSSSPSSPGSPELTEEQLLTMPPWIPAFCLRVNKWGFVLIGEYLQGLETELDNISQLELEESTKTQVLNLVKGMVALGSSPVPDHHVSSRKGLGLNVLLHGNTGVGKTTTAEAVAKFLERPLYRLCGGDLGTSVAELEGALEKAFHRSRIWRAVMLVDEADAFMMKRDEAGNLEQMAMVSAVLRKLEYQDGVVFMTTNRYESIDHAILSRMHVKIHYPALTAAAGVKVWKSHLAKLKPGHTISEDELITLSKLLLDGRTIANVTYLASIMAAGKVITQNHIQLSLPLAAPDKA